MTTTVSSAPTRTPAAAVGFAAGLLALALSALGAHDWTELLVEVGLICVTTLGVFGFLVPRALRRESAPGPALGLSIPALLLVVPAFWSGLPLVLGVGGLLVGNAGRTARTGSGRCIAAVVVGALAVLAYIAIYVGDLGFAGSRGFLVD